MKTLSIDIETYSDQNLAKCGVYRYVESPVFDILLFSYSILCHAMHTLRHCSIVMHIHDEVVIEADRTMSLQAVCDQMGRTPPWAKGLQLRADGYETNFYKKD